MTETPETTPHFVERLRTSDLPPDATIALYFAEPGRTILAAREIQRIQCGEVPPIRADIDPLTAFVVICYLESVLLRGGATHGTDHTARRFIEDLETALSRDCPELAAVLARGRAVQPGGQA